MSRYKIILGLADFKAYLSTKYINPSNFSPAVAKQYSELSSGAFVVALKGFKTNVSPVRTCLSAQVQRSHV